ncbi:hypothetical protein ACIPPS_23730 [Streptomyces sp. NPDC090127]|uniref:hypothetical protein n=1 Tax=Streptomyces sp. NPDC090127 TaxID=3365953 RepID=UPI0037F5E0FB
MPAPTAAATARPADLHAPASPAAPARGPGRRRSPEPPGRATENAAGGGAGAASGAGSAGAADSAAESAGDVVRWAAFCCVLVPVVLVAYGTSLGGAVGTALGLAAVTAVCRVLLRRAEHGLRAEAAAPRATPRAHRSHGGRNHRQG